MNLLTFSTTQILAAIAVAVVVVASIAVWFFAGNRRTE
jgi:hypothetical protein